MTCWKKGRETATTISSFAEYDRMQENRGVEANGVQGVTFIWPSDLLQIRPLNLNLRIDTVCMGHELAWEQMT